MRCILFCGALLAAGLMSPVRPLPADEPAVEAGAKADPAAKAQWLAKFREWRKWMVAETPVEGQTRDDARAAMGAIDDPAAIPVILSLLKGEKYSQFRRALIRPLINLGGEDAVAMLVKLSVEDDNAVLRQEAAEGLAGKPELPQHLEKYIQYLHKPQSSTAAAQALRWTKLATRQSESDPLDPKLTKALIDGLVQKVKKRVPYWVAVDTGWIPHTGTGSGFGNFRHREYAEGWVVVSVPEPNAEVKKTLSEYSSQNHEYDQPKWRKEVETKRAR